MRRSLPLLSLALALASPARAEDPPALEFHRWSGEINVPDPVSLSVAPDGRIFVTQTRRRKAADLDIREFRHWIPDDVALRTIEDKRSHFHRQLAPELSSQNKGRIADHNRDGSHDWRDLTAISEAIHVLEDTDADGTADRLATFAEDFATEVTGIAAGLLYHQGTVYATIAPDLWALRDTDGDGVADARQSIAHGFGVHIAYAGHDMHGLTVGPDGRIYWTIGDKGLHVVDGEGNSHAAPHEGAVLRCEPDGSGFQIYARGLRNVQEIAFDSLGNLFGVDNDADMPGEKERFLHIVPHMDAGWRCYYQYRGKAYNPWTEEGLWKPIHPAQPAYLLSARSSYHDGPAGFAYNPGTALSPAHAGHFFLTGAPKGQQWAFTVKPAGASYDQDTSLTVGGGIPLVGIDFGTDGALYGVDWGGGYPLNQSGAVYRIDVPAGHRHPLRAQTQQILATGFADLDTDTLLGLLGHPDLRVRQGAQFKLAAARELAALSTAAANPEISELAHQHALRALGQLGRAGADDALAPIVAAIHHPSPETRTLAASLLSDLPPSPTAALALIALVVDPSPRVRLHAALALANHPHTDAFPAIETLVTENARADRYLDHAAQIALAALPPDFTASLVSHPDPNLRLALAVALRRQQNHALAGLLHDPDPAVASEAAIGIHDDGAIPAALPALAQLLDAPPHPDPRAIRRAINANFLLGETAHAIRLAAYVARADQPDPLRLAALEALENWPQPPRLDLVTGRALDLPERSVDGLSTALAPAWANLLSSSPDAVLARAMEVAKTLGLNLADGDMDALFRAPDTPPALRLAAFRLLPPSPETTDLALASDDPQLRLAAARSVAETDPSRAAQLLDARLAAADAPSSEKQQALAALAQIDHPDAHASLAEAARQLVEGTAPQALMLDIQEAALTAGLDHVLAPWQAALAAHGPLSPDAYPHTLQGGDPALGAQLFSSHLAAQCSACHKAGDGPGSEVGPDLSLIGQQDPATLLESLVNPGAKLSEGYGALLLTLKDGSSLTGNLLAESPDTLTLRLPDATTREIPAADIASRAGPLSLMPPMGTLLTPREIRDLIAYLQTLPKP